MKIVTGIASSTHIDKHNERFTKNALDGASENIKDKYIPLLLEHNWDQQIGIILYGDVFQLDDGEYALGFVGGVFEDEKEKDLYKIGETNILWNKYKKYFIISELKGLINSNEKNIEFPVINYYNIADQLEYFLNSTEITPGGIIYKIKRFVASTGDLKIEIYPNDHNPQHFHVISKQRNINARFDSNTFEYINDKFGKITTKDKKKIKEFLSNNPKFINKLKTS